MRSISIFTLLVASASFASATVVTFNCQALDTQAVSPGVPSTLTGGGTTQVTCSGNGPGNSFAAPNALNQITNFTLSLLGTFQDGDPNNGTHQLSFAGASSQGGFAATNTSAGTGFGGLDIPNFVNSNTIGDRPQFLFTVTTANVGANLPNSASYSVTGTYTYELIPTNDPAIPEPSTLALVGGVLVLAGIRKFRS